MPRSGGAPESQRSPLVVDLSKSVSKDLGVKSKRQVNEEKGSGLAREARVAAETVRTVSGRCNLNATHAFMQYRELPQIDAFKLMINREQCDCLQSRRSAICGELSAFGSFTAGVTSKQEGCDK